MTSYRFAGIDTAMQILRPNASYEMNGLEIVNWNDERPQPTLDELLSMIAAIKNFEDQQVMYVVNQNDEINEVNIQEFMENHSNKIST